MRLEPTPSTVKRLFALSGNKCAFPGCTQVLVDAEQHLVAQICHIEGAEPAGERYNSNQSDEERRAFENLILLCANHHLVTDDTVKYTVDVLKAMKAEHEKRAGSQAFDVSDNIIDRALRNLRSVQTVVNVGSGLQPVTQHGDVHVSVGLSSTEVVGLFRMLFEENFPRMRQVAHDEAQRRVEQFGESFWKQAAAAKATAEQFSRFEEPDVQAAAEGAVRASARTSSESLRDQLAALLLMRLQSVGDLQTVVMNEALLTVPKLTPVQLRGIALLFMVMNTSVQAKSWPEFHNYLNKFVLRFLGGVEMSQADAQHLAYSGSCTFNALITSSINSVWIGNYPSLFSRPFTEEELGGMSPPISAVFRNPQVTRQEHSGRRVVLGANELNDFLDRNKVNAADAEGVRKTISNHAEDFRATLQAHSPNALPLFDKWDKSPLPGLSLTTVGMAIAISIIERECSTQLNRSIWIP